MGDLHDWSRYASRLVPVHGVDVAARLWIHSASLSPKGVGYFGELPRSLVGSSGPSRIVGVASFKALDGPTGYPDYVNAYLKRKQNECE